MIPIVGADRYLHKMLLQYAEETLERQTPERTTLRSRVEEAALLPHGKAEASAVARELGVSHRTLARLLAAEGHTFSKINQYRVDRAKSYLTHGELSISQVAWLLGYREVSTFTRAFKRWCGVTPTQQRAGARGNENTLKIELQVGGFRMMQRSRLTTNDLANRRLRGFAPICLSHGLVKITPASGLKSENTAL